jgi:DNA-binding IclR family transcriptional regulator
VEPFDEELVRALRRAPNCTAKQLARKAGLPRTNLGRPLIGPVHAELERMTAAGIVERRGRRYRLR